MSELPEEITDFERLCKYLTENNLQRIYLIHSVKHEVETRRFAARLRNKGFIPIIAADFRRLGEAAVTEAIAISEFSLVVAFDDTEMRWCKKQGCDFITVDFRSGAATK